MLISEDPTDVEEIEPLGSVSIETTSVRPGTLDDDERAIGPYRVYGRIASGGMASVYLACREGGRFKQVVAVKRMHSHLAKRREYVEMFLDEVRLASRVRHPYVTSIIDYGQAQGRPYMVMEYVAGESLSSVMARLCDRREMITNPRYPHVVVRLVANLAEGLHAAHEATDDRGQLLGLVHRDVNPPNLFVVGDGSVRVIDFGVACAERRLHHTRTGILKGKIGYMAPEAFRREALDRRADVWSLGVVMWELLTLQRLFRRPSEMETIVAVCSDSVPRPSSLNPVVPRPLEAVLSTALRADRANRYQTAHDFARDLENLLDQWGDPVPPGDLGRWLEEIFPASRDRHRKLLSAVRRQHQMGESADTLPALVSPRTPTPPRLPTVPRWPLGFWRTLGVAASLEVLVMVVLAWTAFKSRPEAPRVPVPHLRAAAALASEPAPAPPKPAPVVTVPAVVVSPPAPAAAPEKPAPPRPVRRHAARPRPQRTAVADPAPAAVAESGQVFISTPGTSAVVTFEDRFLARTPCYVILPAGRQRITLTYAGQPAPTPIEVNVSPRGLVKVRATLER